MQLTFLLRHRGKNRTFYVLFITRSFRQPCLLRVLYAAITLLPFITAHNAVITLITRHYENSKGCDAHRVNGSDCTPCNRRCGHTLSCIGMNSVHRSIIRRTGDKNWGLQNGELKAARSVISRWVPCVVRDSIQSSMVVFS